MARIKGDITKNSRPTNAMDVAKAIVDGFFDLISLNKVAAIAVLWFILRDMIFVFKLPDDYNYAQNLLNAKIIEYFLGNDNIIVVVETAFIVFLVVACIALILYCRFLRKEIDRMAEVRSRAIHGKEKIRVHNSSGKNK